MNFSVTLFNFLLTIFKMKTKLDCLKLINFIEKSIDFKKIFYLKNILIAYSGGQDSSALLAIFYILSKKMAL
jgi:predicted phosphoadenosine phosphosulfate sulfurtransferase